MNNIVHLCDNEVIKLCIFPVCTKFFGNFFLKNEIKFYSTPPLNMKI